MSQQSYPVLIQAIEYRIAWVEADDASQAAEIVNDNSQYVTESECYDTDWTAKAPADKWDWRDVYSPAGAAPLNSAHVAAHQAWLAQQRGVNAPNPVVRDAQ